MIQNNYENQQIRILCLLIMYFYVIKHLIVSYSDVAIFMKRVGFRCVGKLLKKKIYSGFFAIMSTAGAIFDQYPVGS